MRRWEKRFPQAGTLAGNPLAMSAGLEQLRMLREGEAYAELERKGDLLRSGMLDNLRKLGLNYTVNGVGAMICQFFTDAEVTDYDSASTSDVELFKRFFWEMIKHGVYLAPSQFECWVRFRCAFRSRYRKDAHGTLRCAQNNPLTAPPNLDDNTPRGFAPVL